MCLCAWASAREYRSHSYSFPRADCSRGPIQRSSRASRVQSGSMSASITRRHESLRPRSPRPCRATLDHAWAHSIQHTVPLNELSLKNNSSRVVSVPRKLGIVDVSVLDRTSLHGARALGECQRYQVSIRSYASERTVPRLT